jgi:heme A synthase
MVNIPYRSSESLMAERISVRASALRRIAGAIVLAIAAALILGALLSRLPAGFGQPGLQNLIPFDDPIALSTFTA